MSESKDESDEFQNRCAQLAEMGVSISTSQGFVFTINTTLTMT